MNKNTEKKTAKLLIVLSVVTALVSVAVRSVLTLTVLDPNYGVYEQGVVLPTVYHILLTVICLFMAGYAILNTKTDDNLYFAPRDGFGMFTSLVCGFLLAADLVASLVSIAVGALTPGKFDILEMCFALPAIVYFICMALKPEKRSPALAFTSFFPIAWCAVCLIRIYFDTTVLMTSPDKILGQIALLSAMIFFLTESRMQVSNFSSRLFLAAASVAPVLLLTSALPDILLGGMFPLGKSHSIVRYAVEIAFSLFAYSRLASYAVSGGSSEDQTNTSAEE